MHFIVLFFFGLIKFPGVEGNISISPLIVIIKCFSYSIGLLQFHVLYLFGFYVAFSGSCVLS